MLKFILILICSMGSTSCASLSEEQRLIAESPSVADCLTNSLDSSLYCRGSRAINNVLNNLNKSDKPIVLMRGLEIVQSKDIKRSLPNDVQDLEDNSFLGRFAQFLRTHELNMKFADMLTDSTYNIEGNNIEEGRKKDKGQGMMLAVAVMFGKMMAALGLGGIGMMAMKALGIAMAALMMAAMVGIKSMGHHGHESGHSVQYIADGHVHRRRRSNGPDFKTLPLAYKAWLPKDNKLV